MDKLQKIMNKRDVNGMPDAVSQLLVDWAVMFKGEKLGSKAMHALSSAGGEQAPPGSGAVA